MNISKSVAAGAYSLGLLVMGFTAVAVGILIDRGRHVLVLVGGTVITSGGMLLLAAGAARALVWPRCNWSVACFPT